MSEKKADLSHNKKTGKAGIRVAPWVWIAALAVALAAALLLWWGLNNTQGPDESGQNRDPKPQYTVSFDQVEKVSVNLGYGLFITDVGKYTGIYMEDGTNETVSGVLMIVVTNNGQEAIQYAKINLPVNDETAVFTLSTLPAGQSVVLLEQSRMQWSVGENYTGATLENLAVFSQPLSLCEDQLKLQILDGAVNVTNISGKDIAGDIVIYYKNSAADLYYGGITYRVRIEGGLKAGEIRQIMASHFSDTGSKIMFVTIGQ